MRGQSAKCVPARSHAVRLGGVDTGGGGRLTEFARRFDGTVEYAVPEDLVRSIGESKCEALPCGLMEPFLRNGGHRTGVVSVTVPTVSREVGLVGPFTRQGLAVGALRAVLQAAAVWLQRRWWPPRLGD